MKSNCTNTPDIATGYGNLGRGNVEDYISDLLRILVSVSVKSAKFRPLVEISNPRYKELARVGVNSTWYLPHFWANASL